MYVDQSMLDPIQHSESVVSSSCLKAFPLEFVDHACNAPWCSGRVVVKNVTCCSALDLFNGFDVFLKVGVPNCSCIFKGWANHGGVSGCFHLSSAILEVSA